MIPAVIDFRLTSSCNMCCPFCFGPTVKSSWEKEPLENFFAFFKENGVKYVVLTGGEPTRDSRFEYVVSLLKEMGFQLALSTNGTFWPNEDLRAFILKHFNWIALPVESSQAEVHNSIRHCSFNHHELIYSILPQIRDIAPQIKIKVGTVVTMGNILTIPEILGSLPIMPDIWKLYQLSKPKTSGDYYLQKRVQDNMFEELILKLKAQYQSGPAAIHASYEKERNGTYLFLEPDGKVMTIRNNEEHIIGDYTTCGSDLIKALDENIDFEKVISNFYNSFGYPSVLPT